MSDRVVAGCSMLDNFFSRGTVGVHKERAVRLGGVRVVVGMSRRRTVESL